ncbi:MAG: glutamate ligase domain-containing protein, partial [Patescibacteria group bacterium]
IGAKVKEWDANFRFGKGKIFITEADEFFDNFLNYQPDVIILNNIELDHPDFFKSEEHVLDSFSKFVKNLKGKKVLIINQDSPGIKKLFSLLDKKFLSSINILGYTMAGKPKVNTPVSVRGEIINKDKNSTTFSVKSADLEFNHNFKIKILGEHNVANALGVIILAHIYKIGIAIIGESLSCYSGIGRRLEFIGTKRGVRVYDDYAHHPTEVAATLDALRQKYKEQKIWVIVEPHSYSRTKVLLREYKGVFRFSDEVIIGPIFKARDKETFGISGQSIVEVAEHKNIQSVDSLEDILKPVRVNVKPSDVIVVMGAGESYKWARQILKAI